jgi:hypothetical protein
MSIGNIFENDLLKLIFLGTPIANIADNAASAPFTDYYLALHTADPGEGGNQTTNECAYGSYARQSVARSSGGWTVTNNSVSPNSDVQFPTASSGTETATHVSVGTAASGTGKILFSGEIVPTIPIVSGVPPKVDAGSVITLD